MQKLLCALGLAALLAASGCSTIRQATPLEHGEHRLGVQVGGPLFTDIGVPLPVPLLSLDYGYGVTDSFTAGAALHVTPLLFGLAGMGDVYCAYGLLVQDGFIPSLTTGLDTILLCDFQTSFFAFPELSLTASWKITDFLRVYGGAAAMVNFYPKAAGLPMDGALLPGLPMGLLPSFPVGLQLTLGRLQLSAESRLLRPFTSNRNLILHYIGLGDYGAIGVYLSASYVLGGAK
jgi:hypothetical protein